MPPGISRNPCGFRYEDTWQNNGAKSKLRDGHVLLAADRFVQPFEIEMVLRI